MHFTSGKQLIIKQMGDIPRLEISGKHVSQKFPCIAELQACCFSGKKCDYDQLTTPTLKIEKCKKSMKHILEIIQLIS